MTVNCVQPGLINTAQIRLLYPSEEPQKFDQREIAVRDFGEPEDVGNAVTFLGTPAMQSTSASPTAV
ncbi:SDR family oxidoreductase [Pseudomonas sp. PMCC200344]|uniref:SDR family oxidoreductase n=1 Tax=Pseudomonas sp. PMCC200344 TaxID=3042028 RepID=UPI0032C4525E